MSDRESSGLGALEEQVLVAVVRAGDDAYGMEVRREIEAATGRDLAIGAVYSTLDRLEAKDLLRSRRVQTPDGSRRVFGLTSHGAEALTDTRAMRDRLWQGIDLRRIRSAVRA
jgi:PadR family transcriptional regulator PadR